MRLYAAQQKGAKRAFGGLLTQWQAGQDKGSCGGLTDNTPNQNQVTIGGGMAPTRVAVPPAR